MIDDAQGEQQIVEQAVALENADPGIHADQKAGPEGQDDQHQQEVAQRIAGARDGVGHGVTEEQTYEGRYAGNLERLQVGDEIKRVLPQSSVIVQMQLDLYRTVFKVLPQRRIGGATEQDFRQTDLEHN